MRVGILLPHSLRTLPHWVAAWADEVRRSDFAHLETIVSVGGGPSRTDSTAFRMYRRLFGERLGGLQDPLAPAALPDPIPVFANDLPRPGALDVLIATEPLIPGTLPDLPYPVWWPDWGSEPMYFWEAREDVPVSRVALLGLWPDGSSPVVIDEAMVATDRTIYAGRNRVAPLWTAADMIIDSLRKLHTGSLRPEVLAVASTRSRTDTPGAMTLASWVLPALGEKVLRRLKRPPRLLNEWRVAVRRSGDLLRQPLDFSGFTFLPAPPGRFYADPFPVHAGGECWLFVEDFVRANGRAALSCGRLSADLEFTDVRVILDRPYHLSFPHVFEHAGQWYMMPESNANGTLDLYVADGFPYEWRWLKTLWRGKVVDASLWFGPERVWWFLTVVEPKGRGMKLLLFHSETLETPWQPHPSNPISRDVRTARGGGAIFCHEGRLYRPSQDCGFRYGYGFRINEILNLDPERYSERELLFAEPTWAPGMLATHTYNRSRDVEAIDGNWFVPEQV